VSNPRRPDSDSSWKNTTDQRLNEIELALFRAAVAPKVFAKGIRTTAFNVDNSMPGIAVMPFETTPVGSSVYQQRETHAGMIDKTNGIISFPEDGIYAATAFFTFSAAMQAGTALDTMIMGDLFGTSGQRVSEVRTPVTAPIHTVSAIFAAEIDDYIQLVIGQNTGATQSTGSGNANLPWYLAVHKICELPAVL
jgi:hypothetical protein